MAQAATWNSAVTQVAWARVSRPPISRAYPTAWTAAPSGGVRQRWPDLPVVSAADYAHVALPDDAVVVTKCYDLDGPAARIETARRRRR